jgi:hypothetical protein
MTQEEQEFAGLLMAYSDAKAKSTTLEHNNNRAPEYDPDQQGFISVSTIAKYKRELVAYEATQAAIRDALTELTAARSGLEAYFPPAVKAMFEQNVGMFAPVPGGVMGILKEGADYALFMGRDRGEARAKMDSYFQMRNARRGSN